MRCCVFMLLFLLIGTPVIAQQAATPEPGQGSEAKAPEGQAQTAGSELRPSQSEEGKLLTSSKIKSGSRVFISPMESGFENFIVAGIQKKQVPLVVVIDRSKADYEISGISNTEKAGWAKMMFLGSQQSNEEASIKVTDLKAGTVVFAYSVHKTNSYKGRQSAGEACAKHLKEIIE
jgi:hypothetical protein